MMAPEFAKAAAALAPGVPASCGASAAPSEVSARVAIRGLPLLITFQGGRGVARQAGAQPAAGIERWVRSVVAERV
jgi:thioredoxin 2